MSLINTTVKPFKATPCHRGSFVEGTDESPQPALSLVTD
jgi:hypothetical protein